MSRDFELFDGLRLNEKVRTDTSVKVDEPFPSPVDPKTKAAKVRDHWTMVRIRT